MRPKKQQLLSERHRAIIRQAILNAVGGTTSEMIARETGLNQRLVLDHLAELNKEDPCIIYVPSLHRWYGSAPIPITDMEELFGPDGEVEGEE